MPVRITKVACQGCGADLEVDESVRFVTCRYCGSRLEVCHQPSSIYTRLLERVEKTQRSTERELRLIRLERRLDRLDRQWERFVASASYRQRDGSRRAPAEADGVIIMVLVSLLAAIGIMAGFAEHWGLAIPGFAIFGIGWRIASGARRRGREFAAARMRYLEKKAELKREIAGLEREAAGTRRN